MTIQKRVWKYKYLEIYKVKKLKYLIIRCNHNIFALIMKVLQFLKNQTIRIPYLCKKKKENAFSKGKPHPLKNFKVFHHSHPPPTAEKHKLCIR